MSEATADLNENMTSEEISEYAASVAEEVAQERQGEKSKQEPEKKSDAEIIAGNSPAPETTAEDKSGSESVEATGQDEKSGTDVEAAEWLTDDVKAEASAYGISESEIADFTSREELDRALRLFDKSALEAGRKAMAESDGQARNEKGQFVKKEEAEPKSEEEAPKTDRYEVSLGDEYDEEVIAEFTKMRDHYDSRLEALEQYFAQATNDALVQRFDNLVDKLGHTELFGKTGEESEDELQRRRDLQVAVDAQLIGLERLGRPTEMTEHLIKRVANMVFADELRKKDLKQRTRKISKQNDMRQGGSPTKPLPPRDDPREEADRLYKELERAS